MKQLLMFVAAASLSLSACAGAGGAVSSAATVVAAGADLPPPSSVSNRTKIDEQAGLTVTLSYTAAAKLAKLAIRTGIVSDPVTIRKVGAADLRAKAAVDAVRSAYLAANADGYAAALFNARLAVSELVASVKGA